MSYFLYLTVRRVPMHRLVFNLADALLYSSCWWASGLGLIGIYYPQARGWRGSSAGCKVAVATAVATDMGQIMPANTLALQSHLLTPIPPFQYWPKLTTAFLAGVGPVGVVAAGVTYLRLRRMWRVAALFEHWTPTTPRRETHRFADQYEVEVVAR